MPILPKWFVQGAYLYDKNGPTDDANCIGFVDFETSTVEMYDNHTKDEVVHWLFTSVRAKVGEKMQYPTPEQYEVFNLWAHSLVFGKAGYSSRS